MSYVTSWVLSRMIKNNVKSKDSGWNTETSLVNGNCVIDFSEANILPDTLKFQPLQKCNR